MKTRIRLKITRFVAFFAILLFSVSFPHAASAITYRGATMNFAYPEEVTTSDCSNPARGAGYYGDVYRVTSNASDLNLYIEAGSLGDPFVQVLDANRSTVLSQDDDAGGGLNSFLQAGAVTTDQYIIATTYGAGATGTYILSSSVALTKITNCPQVITFANPGNNVYGSNFTVTASTNMSLAVTMESLTASICTVSASATPSFTITPLTPGTCQLRASQAGNGSVSAADPVTQSFTVTAKPLTLTGLSANKDFDNSTAATVTGTPTISGVVNSDDVVLTGSVSGATFSSADAGSRTVTVTGLSISGTATAKYTFSPTFTATIAKINQTAVWEPTLNLLPSNSGSQFAAGSSTGSGSITYAVTSAGTTACTVSGRVLSFSGTGSCSVRMTAASNTNYNAATVDKTFVISRLNQTAAWTPEVNLLVADSGLSLAAGSTDGGGTITYSVTSAGTTGCTLSGLVLSFSSPGNCTVRMTAPINGDFAVATIDKTFVISKPAQTITWAQKTQFESGSDAKTLDPASASDSGSITYSVQDAGTAGCVVAGSSLSFTKAGTCIVRALASETTNFGATHLDVTITISDPVVADPISPNANLFNFDLPFTTRDDKIPAITDSTIQVLVNGYVQTLKPIQQLETSVALDLGQGTAITLKTLGAEAYSEKAGTLVSERGGLVEISGTGFAAESQITVWIFSKPLKLGVFKVDSFGKLSNNLKIPSSLPIGSHNLQLVSRFADGNVRAVMLKINVTPEPLKLSVKFGGIKKTLLVTNSEFNGKKLTAAGKNTISAFISSKKRLSNLTCQASYTSAQNKTLIAERAKSICNFVGTKLKIYVPKTAVKVTKSKAPAVS